MTAPQPTTPLDQWIAACDVLAQTLVARLVTPLGAAESAPQREIPTNNKYPSHFFPAHLQGNITRDGKGDVALHPDIPTDDYPVHEAAENLIAILRDALDTEPLYPAEEEAAQATIAALQSAGGDTPLTLLRAALWQGHELVRTVTEPATDERIPVDELNCASAVPVPRWETAGDPPSPYLWEECAVGGGIFAYVPSGQSDDGDNDPTVCAADACREWWKSR